MPYVIEILITIPTVPPIQEWQAMRPSGLGSKPYRYETREEAARIGSICYPEVAPGSVRIREVGL